MYSNIGITEQGFWLIKRFFYNRNRWSNSGPDDFEVGLKPGLRSRSRKEWEVWGGVGFLTTLGVGFFSPSPDVQLDHFLNHILKLGIPCWNGIVSFETFVETEISCCAPRLPLIVAVKFHSLYVEESESGVGIFRKAESEFEILGWLELESDIFPHDSATLLKTGTTVFTGDLSDHMLFMREQILSTRADVSRCWTMLTG